MHAIDERYPHTNIFGRRYHMAVDGEWTPSHHPIAVVDLAAGPDTWRKALRKSSRSLVNWGRRNLEIVCVSRTNPEARLFAEFQAFHAKIAGRVTRPDFSWHLQCNEILNGRGELILGYLDKKLVSGAMFIDGTEISVYWSAVYDRSQFDKPLGHCPLWLAMEHAKARGLKLLELGEVPDKGTISEKEYNIGYFKRGFATGIVPGQLALLETDQSIVPPLPARGHSLTQRMALTSATAAV